MKGYYNNQTTSKEIIENWFHTGDVGEIDNNGFVSTGRKKEIYVSSAGKNIAPLVIEETRNLYLWFLSAFLLAIIKITAHSNYIGCWCYFRDIFNGF